MQHNLFDLAAAREARDKGIALALSSEESKNWVARCRNYAWSIAILDGSVSADTILKDIPRPESVSPNATGAIFRHKCFRLIGYKQSTKVSSHARRIGIYEAVEGELPS